MIETLIAATGLVIAYLTYRKTFHAKPAPPHEPKEEKDNLLAHFRIAQRNSLEVHDLLRNYINKGNGNKLMYEHLTFQQMLDMALSEYERCLSDKLYQDLVELPMTKSNIESMQKMLDTQNENLLVLRGQLIALNKSN